MFGNPCSSRSPQRRDFSLIHIQFRPEITIEPGTCFHLGKDKHLILGVKSQNINLIPSDPDIPSADFIADLPEMTNRRILPEPPYNRPMNHMHILG